MRLSAGRVAIAFFALFIMAPWAPGALAQGALPVIPGGAPKGPIKITAPSLEYFDRERKLVYSGGVVATQGDATLKAGSLIILLNDGAAPQAVGPGEAPGGNQIKRIEATGPVSVVQKNQVGTGDSGLYERAANKLTLSGNVTLSQCANVLKGDRLVYDLAAGRASVQGRVSSLLTPGVACDDGSKPRPVVDKTPAQTPPATKPTDRRPQR